MRFRSTRGGEETDLLDAVDRGIAPDGGLWVPTSIPALPPPPVPLAPTFQATAGWGLRHLLGPSIAPEVLDRIVMGAMALDVPVERSVHVGPSEANGRISLLDLTRGPTRAFKDVGARFLASLWALHPGGGARTVLVATSGDTGGAVADACHGLPGLRVVVLFPEGRVSELQRRQFTTLGGNVTAVAVNGPFDRCQALVKEAFADPALVSRHRLTSSNSINPGRLIPQILPYLHLARRFGWSEERPGGRPGTVVVPSGNLGNVWAALFARATGAPLGRIVAACNRNDTLVRWLEDGETTGRDAVETPSTAMDVGVPSNLERIARMRDALGALEAAAVDDDATLHRMRSVAEAGRPVDPHTAVGIEVASDLPAQGSAPDGPVTVVETASPAKFPEVLRRAGVEPVDDPDLRARLDVPERIRRLGPGEGLPDLLRELHA